MTRARRLRRDMTQAERRLWRGLQQAFPGEKWRRQAPVGAHVVDFLNLAARLIIEVDGGQHADQAAADAARTRDLEALGLRVVRFWNADVLANLPGVIELVAVALTQPSPVRERA